MCLDRFNFNNSYLVFYKLLDFKYFSYSFCSNEKLLTCFYKYNSKIFRLINLFTILYFYEHFISFRIQ